jgi:hypothetical protein
MQISGNQPGPELITETTTEKGEYKSILTQNINSSQVSQGIIVIFKE